MNSRDEQRLSDVFEAITAIESHLTRGDLSDGLIFDAVRIRLPEIGAATDRPVTSRLSVGCGGRGDLVGFMRGSVIRSVTVLGAVGAVASLVIALGLRWWTVHHAPTEFGYYSFSSSVSGDDIRIHLSSPWWGQLWSAVVAGLALGVIVAVVLAMVGRRLILERSP